MAGEYAYSKRPLWQWILIYVVLGVTAYGLIYYFIFARRGNTYTAPVTSAPTSTAVPSSLPTTPSTTLSTPTSSGRMYNY